MATSIQMNILTSNNTYTPLYPETDYSLLQNKPIIPSLPLSIENGGTGTTTIANFKTTLNQMLKNKTVHSSTYIGDGSNSHSLYQTIPDNETIFVINLSSSSFITVPSAGNTGMFFAFCFINCDLQVIYSVMTNGGVSYGMLGSSKLGNITVLTAPFEIIVGDAFNVKDSYYNMKIYTYKII